MKKGDLVKTVVGKNVFNDGSPNNVTKISPGMVGLITQVDHSGSSDRIVVFQVYVPLIEIKAWFKRHELRIIGRKNENR